MFQRSGSELNFSFTCLFLLQAFIVSYIDILPLEVIGGNLFA